MFVFIFAGCEDAVRVEQKKIEEETDHISKMIDGPYVLNNGTGLISYTADYYGNTVSENVKYGDTLKVIVPYREPEVFLFMLRKDFTVPDAETEGGDKIFATSDIEGNYYALTKLLIGNGIVDEKLNWTFWKNHLVFDGDMVDRGEYVTQVLWLMYKLDRQAQKAGGHVHFILGNHDVMCMAGDSRYARDKYLDMAVRLNIEYKELYGEKSEIGRWMRTRNAIEKVNGYIFLHAGISSDVLDLDMSLKEMNGIMRPYYGMKITDTVPNDVYKLFKTSGILWYWGCQNSKSGAYPKATDDLLERTLARYGAKAVVVGHCLVDKIETRYSGNVVMMDVHHT